MADIAKILDEIKNLTVIDLSKLVKAIEEEFGVSAAAPAAVAVAAAPGAAAPAAVEEKTEFDVVLKEVGPNKVPVIKVVRDATGLGLVDAKALVDGAPKTIKEGIAKAAAEEIVAKFKEAGATAEIK
ncbi:MAG: 50S ribosomal protein L7/L12 [Clostridiales bacterium]|jgi:large subunit ribosomal protein L7/L12|nr:50S ribosomal protein L7/L12 [Clostridiales bacterium]